MPKGAKKRAKLKKQKQQGHPDDRDNNTHHNGNGSNASGRRDQQSLRIPPKAPHVDGSEDSMESSEEMVTPRAAGSEPDEEERKAAADVHVERAVDKAGEAAGDSGEEVMVDALSPPETSGQVPQGKDDAEVEVHAVVQEPEVKDVVVDEAHAVQEPEAAEAPVVEVREVRTEEAEEAKVHPVPEPEPVVDDAVVVGETPAPPVAHHEPDIKGGNVVVKDSSEVSRSREPRGPAVAVAAAGHRATWWNCCGLFDAFSGSER